MTGDYAKRPVDAKGGGPGGKNRHAKRRYSPADDFKQGLQGIMITCDIHREKQAVRECFGLLEQLIGDDGVSSSAAAAACSDAGATAGSALAQELADLGGGASSTTGAAGKGKGKRGGKARKFSSMQTGCGGNIFIKFEDVSLDPLELADRIFDQAIASAAHSHTSAAPHVIRLLPVQMTCVANVDEIAKAATALAWALCGSEGSYSVQWKRRCNSSIDKMSVIDAVAGLVPKVAPKATVSLKSPDAAILVDVIKNVSCVSVLPKWRQNREYNLRECTTHGAATSGHPPPSVTPAAPAGVAAV